MEQPAVPQAAATVAPTQDFPGGPAPLDPVTALQQQVAQLGMAVQQYQQQLTALHQQRGSRGPKVPKPPEFNGRQPTPLNWCYSMETYLAAEGGLDYLATPAAAITAAGYLRGAALNWWRNHQQSVERGLATVFNTWTQFKEALVKQFTPIAPGESAREKLDTLRQTRSVYAYAQEYTSCMLELPNMDEADKVHRFINGLKPSVKIHVKLQKPATLSEAIELAIKADALLWSGGKPWLRDQPRNTNANTGPVPMELGNVGNTVQLDTVERKAPRDPRNKQPIRCFKCNKLGHMARDCRSKRLWTNARKSTN